MIDISKIIFLSTADVKTSSKGSTFLRDTQNYRVFIDELEYFITEYFNIKGSKFYATIDSHQMKPVYRSDWDETYEEKD